MMADRMKRKKNRMPPMNQSSALQRAVLGVGMNGAPSSHGLGGKLCWRQDARYAAHCGQHVASAERGWQAYRQNAGMQMHSFGVNTHTHSITTDVFS
jgi:hypothetical protein